MSGSDERFRLECECHDMRCFAGFDFGVWPADKNFPALPYLDINVLYHPGNIFQRLKTAWKVIRRNEWHEEADISLYDYRKIEALRDFLNRCLANEKRGEGK